MVVLTMEEAEKFFKKYLGYHFHMYREDPYTYTLYKRLSIPKELEQKWLKDLENKKKNNYIFFNVEE